MRTHPPSAHQESAAYWLRFRFCGAFWEGRTMMTDPTLPAAVPLRLPPRSAYAAPSSKSSKSTQRLKSSLTYYPIRPFVPLHVCMKDLTADIFHGRDLLSCSTAAPSLRRSTISESPWTIGGSAGQPAAGMPHGCKQAFRRPGPPGLSDAGRCAQAAPRGHGAALRCSPTGISGSRLWASSRQLRMGQRAGHFRGKPGVDVPRRNRSGAAVRGTAPAAADVRLVVCA